MCNTIVSVPDHCLFIYFRVAYNDMCVFKSQRKSISLFCIFHSSLAVIVGEINHFLHIVNANWIYKRQKKHNLFWIGMKKTSNLCFSYLNMVNVHAEFSFISIYNGISKTQCLKI